MTGSPSLLTSSSSSTTPSNTKTGTTTTTTTTKTGTTTTTTTTWDQLVSSSSSVGRGVCKDVDYNDMMVCGGSGGDVSSKSQSPKIAVENKGYPGYLTAEEYKIFEQFEKQVSCREDEFRSTLYCFENAGEEKKYALCRWLRARKFNLEDTINMVEEAMECRSSPSSHNFFPCPKAALGVCEESIYKNLYPQVGYGHTKCGKPLFISQIGKINISGIECVTSLKNILNYHWYDMMHKTHNQLKETHTSSSGTFKRYEFFCIFDMNGLTTSQLTRRALEISRIQSEIDSLCFPETLFKLFIINAPSFFSMTWRIIRSWGIDERTASKVQIFSSSQKDKWIKLLKEFVEDDNLPSNYGGSGPSLNEFQKQETIKQYNNNNNISGSSSNSKSGGVFVDEKVLHFAVRGSHTSHTVHVKSNQYMELIVFTRSVPGGQLHVKSPSGKMLTPLNGILVCYNGNDKDVATNENSLPTRIELSTGGLKLQGEQGSYKIKIESNASMFSTEDFIVVGKLFNNNNKNNNHNDNTEEKDHRMMSNNSKSIISSDAIEVKEKEKDERATTSTTLFTSSLSSVPSCDNDGDDEVSVVTILSDIYNNLKAPLPVARHSLVPLQNERSSKSVVPKEEEEQRNDKNEKGIESSSASSASSSRDDNVCAPSYSYYDTDSIYDYFINSLGICGGPSSGTETTSTTITN